MRRIETLFFITYFLFLNLSAISQNPHRLLWAKQATGSGEDKGFACLADFQGNIYTAGQFSGTTDFDPGPGTFNLSTTGLAGAFILKTDNSGNFIWARQFAGSTGTSFAIATSVAYSYTDEIIISGNFSGLIDFDPGPATFNIQSTNNGPFDMFVLKVNASGDLVWVKRFAGTNSNNGYLSGVTVDSRGNILVTGFFDGVFDFDPGSSNYFLSTPSSANQSMFVSKLDSNGNFMWAKQVGDSRAQCFGFSVKTDNNDNVFLTGSFGNGNQTGIVDFDPGTGVSDVAAANGNDIFVLKLNASGNLAWVRSFNPGENDVGRNIYVDQVGGVTVTGFYSTGSTSGVYFLKAKVTGQVDFEKTFIGNDHAEGHSVARDVDGNFFIAGYFNGTVDFDPGPGVYNMTASGRSDIFISELDVNGNFLTASRMGSSGNNAAYGITTDASRNIYLTGQFENTVDFDPRSTVFNLSSDGSEDVFLVKLNHCFHTQSQLNLLACKTLTLNGQIYSSSGNYVQTINNSAGCDSIIHLNVTMVQSVKLLVSKKICEGESFDGYNKSGVYTDTIRVANVCDTVRTLNLTVEPCDIFFPSAFTPNNDGRNDLFKALTSFNLSSFHLTVYNRLGEKVFETRDHTKGWDGTFNNQKTETGVFVWFCEFLKPGSAELKRLRGTFSLIR